MIKKNDILPTILATIFLFTFCIWAYTIQKRIREDDEKIKYNKTWWAIADFCEWMTTAKLFNDIQAYSFVYNITLEDASLDFATSSTVEIDMISFYESCITKYNNSNLLWNNTKNNFCKWFWKFFENDSLLNEERCLDSYDEYIKWRPSLNSF